MRKQLANERPLRNPEVVLNLWAYSSENGHILRLAGKAYVLDGNDEEKLTVLRVLSATDFLSAIWQEVPENFHMIYSDGRKMNGIATASALSDPDEHSHLFGPLIETLAGSIPDQMSLYNGKYRKIRVELPEIPLAVTTVVMECEDGQLVPMLSKHD